MNPQCPKCGITMTEKQNSRTGAPFWGCVNYPQCDGIIPFLENKNFGMKQPDNGLTKNPYRRRGGTTRYKPNGGAP